MLINLKTVLRSVLFAFPLAFSQAQAADLHLYADNGGEHVYLGCFSCSPYNSSSIWNEYGTYGSEYSSNSIWNDYGRYGSEYSSASPWNKYATSGSPVLVDKAGNFYGYFTCNSYRGKRVRSDLMDFLCKNREYIKKNRSKAYEKLF